MTILFCGLVLFFGVHVIPLFPAFKSSLQSRLGALRFKGIYSVLAAAGFGLILFGMSRATFQPVFVPLQGAAFVANLAMPVAFSLLVSAYVPNNFRRVIRHPMLLGIGLWAFVHLLSNGDLASIALFGGFGLYSIVDIVAVNARGAAASHARQSLWKDALVLVIGFTAFWAVRYFHAVLFGVPVPT